MLIRPHTLSLITTHQCPAACEDCCFSCGPTKTSRIPHERLISLIDEASELGRIDAIVFTGGECFLLGDELDALVARARGHGLATRCVTNGYWAVSRQAADQRIGRLAQAGLEDIRFSTGTFHSRYIPVERVINGACASARAGLKTRVYMENSNESEFEVDRLLGHSEFQHFISRRLIKLHQGVWVRFKDGDGGASRQVDQSAPARSGGCPAILQALAVTPDEILAACCGFPLEKIPALHFGSVRQTPLDRRIREAPDDLVKIWIQVEGPERIWEFVRRHAPGCAWPAMAAHRCENCHRLFQNEDALRIIRDHGREVEGRIRLRHFIRTASAEAKRVFRRLGTGLAARIRSVDRGESRGDRPPTGSGSL